MNRLSPEILENSFHALAALLEEWDAPRETLVIIGGTALITLGFVSRTTKDVDIMAGVDAEKGIVDPRPMSSTLRAAAAEVAREYLLDEDWLNTGPAAQGRGGPARGISLPPHLA